MVEQAQDFFRESFCNNPAVVAYAPGRIEFVGNHTDYNGGKVLGIAIQQGIYCALSYRNDRKVLGVSLDGEPTFTSSLDDLETLSEDGHWSRYPLGVVWAIQKKGIKLERGFNLAIFSNLPMGAGLSSSAALELSIAYAVLADEKHGFSKKDLVKICMYAENNYVGVPCGILDQGVSGFGREDQLVYIDCKTESFSNVGIPQGTHFWIFNSNTQHSLTDSLYSERFSECAEGLKVAEGFRPGIECLGDFPLSKLDSLADHLSRKIYKRVKHVLYENQRVNDVARHLLSDSVDLRTIGNFLYDSHESSRNLFDNSTKELDFLVSHLREIKSVYGARLTGGGFGGAVMAWTSIDFKKSDAAIISKLYEAAFDHPPRILHCKSGDGVHLI
ncbi:MAG: galactokinase [Opitutaceae bacterium]|nr:galactokinase [Opitutaceae bacterium]